MSVVPRMIVYMSKCRAIGPAHPGAGQGAC